MTAATSTHTHPSTPFLSTMDFPMYGVVGGMGVVRGARGANKRRWVGRPAESKVQSGATLSPFRKTSPSTFFTMLTFSQILNIYLQWMTAFGPDIVRNGPA